MAGIPTPTQSSIDSIGGMQTQIINGVPYKMYTPQWYAAMDAQKVHEAEIAGKAAGTAGGTALTTLQQYQPNALNPNTASSSSSSSSSTTGGGYPATVSMGGGSGTFGTGVFNPGGTGAAANLPPPVSFAAPDVSAAESAAFGRAKDTVGQTTQGALTALRSALGGRGMLGSGGEFRGTSNIITGGQQQLGEAARDQAMKRADLAEKQAELGYTGGISQRGQDLSAKAAADALAAQLAEAQYSGQITQRGQDISAQIAKAQQGLSQQSMQQSMIDRILQSLSSYNY